MNSGTELVLMHAITALAAVIVYGAVFMYNSAQDVAALKLEKLVAAYDLARSMSPSARGKRIARSIFDTQAYGRINTRRHNLLPFQGDVLEKLSEIMDDLLDAMDSYFAAKAAGSSLNAADTTTSHSNRTSVSSARTDSTRFLLGSPAISTGRPSPAALQGIDALRADTAMIQLCFVQLMTLLRVRVLPLATAEKLVAQLHAVFNEEKLRALAAEPYLRGPTLSLAGDAVFYLNCLLPPDTYVVLAQLAVGGEPDSPEEHLFSVCASQIVHFPGCVPRMLVIASEPNLLALLALSLERVNLASNVSSQVGAQIEQAIETYPDYALVLGVAAHSLSGLDRSQG